MIKFFRRLRLNSIGTKNVNNYLWYAIGEVILVVLGILIALQINNWNEHRKERMLELKVLVEIQDNIGVDFDDHHQNLEFLENSIASSQIVLNHLQNEIPYHDSLARHFSWLPIIPDFYSVNSGYQLLSSKGINLITNDSLRKDISFLYNNTHIWVKEFFAFLKTNSFRMLLENMAPRFSEFKAFERYVPNDYKSLISDQEFQSLTQFNMEYLRTFKGAYEDRVELEKDLIDRINGEISRLRK